MDSRIKTVWPVGLALLVSSLTLPMASHAAGYTDVDIPELKVAIEGDSELVVIDVRTQEEIATGAGILPTRRQFNIPRGWLEFWTPDRIPDLDTPIVVYCGTNIRSPLASQTLVDMGYTNVRNFAPGLAGWIAAGEPVAGDDAPRSMLYRKPMKVTDGVWSAIGATAPPSYSNSGHNNNLSFVITSDGVLVVNAGDNYLLAESLHQEIKALTDQPVRYVVLENGQGHAMLGMNYWQAQGATVIAHADTLTEIEEHGEQALLNMINGRADKSMLTELSKPYETFTDKRVITMGDTEIHLVNLGPAHSPGDIVVWLPEKKTVISGDVAFHERLLPVFEHTDTKGWIKTWDSYVALGAEHVVPGHGHPTEGYGEVTKYTRDYLVDVREQIGALIEEGGDLNDAYEIDQSAYAHLDTYFELARQNAGRIFREMEFDW